MLSDAKVRAAKPREKAYKLTDSNRLFLLVTPSGGNLWRWNYSYDGKQHVVWDLPDGLLSSRRERSAMRHAPFSPKAAIPPSSRS